MVYCRILRDEQDFEFVRKLLPYFAQPNFDNEGEIDAQRLKWSCDLPYDGAWHPRSWSKFLSASGRISGGNVFFVDFERIQVSGEWENAAMQISLEPIGVDFVHYSKMEVYDIYAVPQESLILDESMSWYCHSYLDFKSVFSAKSLDHYLWFVRDFFADYGEKPAQGGA